MIDSIQSNRDENTAKRNLVAQTRKQRLLAKHCHSWREGHGGLPKDFPMATLFKIGYSTGSTRRSTYISVSRENE